MSLTPRDRRRRRDAKLFNERLKLSATVLNATAIAVLGGAVILPGIAEAQLQAGMTVWLLIVAALHLSAQAVLIFYRSEDQACTHSSFTFRLRC